MGRDECCKPGFAHQSHQRAKYLIRGAGIEVACGFIRQQQFGFVGQRAAERNALLFAAGKRGWAVVGAGENADMSEQIERNYSPQYRLEHAAREIPVGRYGKPEELACLAVFLASPIAGYITGAVLPVDGGLRRYSF